MVKKYISFKSWKKNLLIFLAVILLANITFMPRIREGKGGSGSRGPTAEEQRLANKKKCDTRKTGGEDVRWNSTRCEKKCTDSTAKNYREYSGRGTSGCVYECKDGAADNTGAMSLNPPACIYKCRDEFKARTDEDKPPCPAIECQGLEEKVEANIPGGTCCPYCKKKGGPNASQSSHADKNKEKKG